MLSKGSGVHSLCPPSYRRMKKFTEICRVAIRNGHSNSKVGGRSVYTVHTMGKKTQLQKTKFTALLEKSPAANRKEMIPVQRTYPTSNWQKESTVHQKNPKKKNCLTRNELLVKIPKP
jgi:hypothetical protein